MIIESPYPCSHANVTSYLEAGTGKLRVRCNDCGRDVAIDEDDAEEVVGWDL